MGTYHGKGSADQSTFFRSGPGDPSVKLLSTFATRFSTSTEGDLYHQITNGQSLLLVLGFWAVDIVSQVCSVSSY